MSDFEKIGPGSPSDHEAKTPLEEGVKKVRDFYNRKEVKDVVRKAERLLKVAKDVKTGNPFSVAHGLFKTAEILYEFDKVSTPPALRKFNAMKEHCHELCTENVTHLVVSMLDPERIEEIESSEGSRKSKGPTLYGYNLYDDVAIYWYNNDSFDYSEVICSEEHDLSEVRAKLSEVLWGKYGSEVEMLWGENREFEFREKPEHPWRYEGDFGRQLISRWQRAFEKGIRRFVILHGPPGTGKSTLARQLGVEIQARVLYVPIQTIIGADSVKYFSDALDFVQPEVVIIDDIDRMATSKLENLLALFEETETEVPLLLATTNHLSRLPGAIKRPGRFDEIWAIQPPPPEVRGRVIKYLASLEDFSLTEKQVEIISDLSGERELSGAHIREIIRRLILEDVDEDWSEISFDTRDLTFSAEWRPSSYQPEGVAVLDDFDDFDDDEEEEF